MNDRKWSQLGRNSRIMESCVRYPGKPQQTKHASVVAEGNTTGSESTTILKSEREMRRIVFPWIENRRTERDLFDTRLRSENQIQ